MLTVISKLFHRCQGKSWPIVAVILCVTFIAYLPVLDAELLNWDDDKHLTDNYYLHELSAENVRLMFTRNVNNAYIPLSLLTLAIECHFFEFDPFIYHFDNLLLHLLATWLVFVLGRRLGLGVGAAGIASLIFGIHPMHVENVAWVTARKDVLYGSLFLAALVCYQSFVVTRLRRYYLATLLFGILSILSKPMGLSLPPILLLMDWMLKRRWSWKQLGEKIPFFAYAVGIALLTFNAHPRTASFTYSQGVLNWIWSFTFYLRKFFFPEGYVPLYRLPVPIVWNSPAHLTGICILITLIVLIWFFRKNRWFIFAFGFYFLLIFYICRFVRFNPIEDPGVVADRFMYMASVGWSLLLGHWAVLTSRKMAQTTKWLGRGFVVIGLLIGLYLAVFTYHQSQVWGNSIKLWTAVLEEDDKNTLAWNNRGAYRYDQKELGASSDFANALELRPDYLAALLNSGLALFQEKKYEESLAVFERAMQLSPSPVVLQNRATVLFEMGRYEEAYRDYETALAVQKALYNNSYNALKILPKSQRVSNQGVVLFNEGKIEEAEKYLDLSLQLDKRNSSAYANRGAIHMERGNVEEAMKDYNRALFFDHSNALAYNNRGAVYVHKGRPDLAILDFDKALKLDPFLVDAYSNRGVSHDRIGQADKSLKDFNAAILFEKYNPKLYNNRGNWYRRQKQWDKALADFTKAIELNASFPEVYLNRARIYQELGEGDLAEKDIKKANHYSGRAHQTLEKLIEGADPQNKE